MTLEIKQLLYFVEIYEHANLSRAAKRMGVAQPALSHHLSNLESYLGVRLFSRSSRGMHLTEAGHRLLPHARAILEQAALAEDEVRGPGEDITKLPFVLGLPPSLANALALPLIDQLQQHHPGLRIRIVEQHSPYLLEGLLAAKLDLVVLPAEAAHSRLEAEKLVEESLFFVTGPAFKATAPGGISFEELAAFRLIVPTFPAGLREQMEEFARAGGVVLNFVAEVQSLTMVRQGLERNEYGAILPRSMMQGDLSIGRLSAHPIIGAPFTREMWLAYPKAPPLGRAGRVVRRELRALVQPLSQEHPAHEAKP